MTDLRMLTHGLNTAEKAEVVLGSIAMFPAAAMIALSQVLEMILTPVVLLWLAAIGEWGPLIVGVLWAFVGQLFISVPLVLGGLLFLPGLWLLKSGSTALKVMLSIPCIALGVLGLLFTAPVVMTGWTYMVFGFAFSIAAGRNAIPVLLMAFYIATSPWRSMLSAEAASQQAGTGQMMVGTVYVGFLQLGCLVMMLMRLIGGKNFAACFTAFLIIMGCSLLASLVPLWLERKYGVSRAVAS